MIKKFVGSFILMSALSGCLTLNSDKTPNTSCSDQPKACGCNGHESCSTMTNCGQCCTPSSCSCHSITIK